MNHLQHPSELNPYQLYQQASKIAKHTSRSKNPAWYAGALEIRRQWHLWVDGVDVVSALFDSQAKRWVEGPTFSCLITTESVGGDEGGARKQELRAEDLEQLHSALTEALRSRELGGKVDALGVILHVADEFAILDPAREYSSNGDFDEVQQALFANPTEVLGDSTADALLHTWRILPCWGVKEGRRNVAVQLGRRREDFFAAVREYGESHNVAIVSVGASAPLEILRLAPLYLDYEPGRGDIIVMVYRNFSALAVLDGEGELLQLRALAHRAGMEYPSGLGETLLNTQTSMGLANPVVSILPMNDGPAQELLGKELTSFFARKTPMDIGFNELGQIFAVEEITGKRSEMLLGDGAGLDAFLEFKPWTTNNTFMGLAAGWASQDFYPISYEEEEKFPDWQELQLQKWFGVVKVVLLVAVVALAVWGGLKVVKATSSEAWQMGKQEPELANQGMLLLGKEEKEMIYWEGIMKKRSPAWLMMQLPLDLFSETSGVVMTTCQYGIKPLASANRGNNKAKDLGYSRQWKISGFATAKSLPYLTKLGSDKYMQGYFSEMADKYNADSFDVAAEGRRVNVTLQRKQGEYPGGGMLPNDEQSAYTSSFTLEIVQKVLPEDDLAFPIVNASKAKKK